MCPKYGSPEIFEMGGGNVQKQIFFLNILSRQLCFIWLKIDINFLKIFFCVIFQLYTRCAAEIRSEETAFTSTLIAFTGTLTAFTAVLWIRNDFFRIRIRIRIRLFAEFRIRIRILPRILYENIHTDTNIDTHIHTHTHTQTYTNTHTYTHAHTHYCVYVTVI